MVATVKAVACDSAGAHSRGLARYTVRDSVARVLEELSLDRLGISTVWEILKRDAIKPWQFRSWIFPRDPEFAARAGVVLDLYGRTWGGLPLGERDFVLSGDEKPGILRRTRCHPTVLPRPGHPGRREFEYRRHGTGVLLALLDIGHGQVFHETVRKNGIDPFRQLIATTVAHERYRHAERLFFVVDNGGSHSRQRFQARLNEWFPRPEYPEMIAVHLPKHASWLNQIELFFSLVGRRALKGFECKDLPTMSAHLTRFIEVHNENPRPFKWRFTKEDLADRMKLWPDATAN